MNLSQILSILNKALVLLAGYLIKRGLIDQASSDIVVNAAMAIVGGVVAIIPVAESFIANTQKAKLAAAKTVLEAKAVDPASSPVVASTAATAANAIEDHTAVAGHPT